MSSDLPPDPNGAFASKADLVARMKTALKGRPSVNLDVLICLVCMTSAIACAAPGKSVLIQVDNEKILLDGSELSSLDVLRTIVANASRDTVMSVEAHRCTKWPRVEEVMEILKERPVPFTVKFSTFGDSDDPVCTRSRGAV